MHPLAQFMQAASYESIVFSHRPCLLVLITVKLSPVDSLHVSDNVKPTCFDELEVHAWNAESRVISEFSRHVADG
jgi:hypothetical protein